MRTASRLLAASQERTVMLAIISGRRGGDLCDAGATHLGGSCSRAAVIAFGPGNRLQGHGMTLFDRRFVVAVLVGAAASVPGLIVELLGGAPWLAIAAAITGLVLLLGQRMSWSLAGAASVAASMAVVAVYLRIATYVPAPLDLQMDVALVIVTVASCGLVGRQGGKLRLPNLKNAVGLAPAILISLALVVGVSLWDGRRIAWAMNNDAVWNTMVARFIVADHGIGVNPNPSPLTGALLAVGMAPGRNALDPSKWLVHDVTREAQLWLFLMLASSLVAGIVAWLALSAVLPIVRHLAVVAVSFVPLTPFVAGNAIAFGFYDATIAVLVLLCAWVAWLNAPAHRLVSFITLAVCCVATLAVWAPLALVPLALAAVVVFEGGLGWTRGIGVSRSILAIIAALAVAGYGLGFTLPDLIREHSALASDGGIFGLSIGQVVVTSFVALASGLAARLVLRRWRDFLGTATVLASSAIVLGYLLLQRGGTNPWGYYPVKFSWLISVLLIVIICTCVISLAAKARIRRAFLTLAGGAALTTGLVWFPIATFASATGPMAVFVPSLARSDSATDVLFPLSDPRQKNLVSGSPDDMFVNGWLIQQQSRSVFDAHTEFRGYAYILDARDPVQLCRVSALWGGGVTVHTNDGRVASELSAMCPDLATAVAGE